MWEKIKGPVWLMIFAVIVLVADLILERFAHIYLVYFGISVIYASPVLFVIGLIWLIVKLTKK
jgi:hypothetical protein